MIIGDLQSAPRERCPTGLIGLDNVLGGGLLRDAVFIVQGSPGSGKTIFGNQVAFNVARRGGRVLYLTMVGESLGRMVGQLSNLSFYNPSEIMKSLFYLSGYSAIARDGVDGLLELIAVEARGHEVSMVVLDGLFVVSEIFDSDQDFRKFINALTHQAELLRCTMLLMTNSARTSSSPEYAMVDGWIELGTSHRGRLSCRFIEIHKFRGSDFVSGRHSLSITNDGIVVYPRVEAVMGFDPGRGIQDGRLTTGIDGLDKMLRGGLPNVSTTLLTGAPGVGKTSFGLQFLSRCTTDHRGLYFGFYETVERLIVKTRTLGIDLEALLESGAVRIIWYPPTENLIDELGHRLVNHVRDHHIRRVVLDGIGPLHRATPEAENIGGFLAALTNELRALGCSAILTAESPTLEGGSEVTFGDMSAVAENIITLQYAQVETAEHRTIKVLKLRDSTFDAATHTIRISSAGLQVGKAHRRPAPGSRHSVPGSPRAASEVDR